MATSIDDAVKEATYNGYANYATWRIASEIYDDQPFFSAMAGLAEINHERLANRLEEWYKGSARTELGDDTLYDILIYALGGVDWAHLAQIILEFATD